MKREPYPKAPNHQVICYLRVSTQDQDLWKNRADTLKFANDRKLGPLTWVEEKFTGKAESDPVRIKEIMGERICRPVLWCQIIQKMLDEGVDLFVEVGPKKVLQGLLSKIAP